MPKLSEVSLFPKPTDEQKVTTCLREFCDTIFHAQLNHLDINDVEGVQDSAIFMKKVITWWKILTVEALGADTRHNDPIWGGIRDPSGSTLQTILEFGDMFGEKR